MSDRKGHVAAGAALILVLAVLALPVRAQTAKITAVVLQVTHRAGATGQWTKSKVGATLPDRKSTRLNSSHNVC
jgi:hypothetical protein